MRLLNPIAFSPAVSGNNYENHNNFFFQLYGQIAPAYDYHTPCEGSLFIDQFNSLNRQLVELIHFYFADNNNYQEILKKNLNEFKLKFTQQGDFGNQSAQFYNEIKFQLESIYVELTKAKCDTNKIGRYRSIFADLLTNIHLCGPGVFTHINTTAAKLNSSATLSQWLAELRLRITDNLAALHVNKKKIPSGNSIHVNNVFYQYAFDQHWHLHGQEKINELNEQFQTLAIVDADDLVKFHEDFLTQYNPATISEEIAERFHAFCAEVIREKTQYLQENKVIVISNQNELLELFHHQELLLAEGMLNLLFECVDQDIDKQVNGLFFHFGELYRIRPIDEIQAAVIFYLANNHYFQQNQLTEIDNNQLILFKDTPEINLAIMNHAGEKIPKLLTSHLREFLENLSRDSKSEFEKICNYSEILWGLICREKFTIAAKLVEQGTQLDLNTHKHEINRRNQLGFTALMLASLHGASKLIQPLIDAGADVNMQDTQGRSALWLALRFGHSEITELLITIGANVNLSDYLSFSPLMLSIIMHNHEITELLIKQNCDLFIRNSQGTTAFEMAIELLNFKAIALLLRHPNSGVELRYREKLFFHMIYRGHDDSPDTLDLLSALIDTGVDPNRLDKGRTALTTAIGLKKTHIAKYLINHPRIDINKTDERGITALTASIVRQNDELVELLLEKNAHLASIGYLSPQHESLSLDALLRKMCREHIDTSNLKRCLMSLFYHLVNTEYGAIHSHLALPDSIFQMTNLYLEHANKPIERHELIQLRNNLLKIGAEAADHKTVFTRLFSTRSPVTQHVYDQFKEVYQDMLQRNLEQMTARY